MDLRHFLAVGIVRASVGEGGRLGGRYLSGLYVERRRGGVVKEKRRNGEGEGVLHPRDGVWKMGRQDVLR
jgi:hypothetical protein